MGILGWIGVGVIVVILWLATVFVLGVSGAGTGETKWQVFNRFCSEIFSAIVRKP